MGMREPVVHRDFGRGRGEPKVGRGLGRGYGGPLGYLRDIRPPGHFPPHLHMLPCDLNPLPPYDTPFPPPYSVTDPDMSACEAPCPFPHHHDPLLPQLTPNFPLPTHLRNPLRQNPKILICASSKFQNLYATNI